MLGALVSVEHRTKWPTSLVARIPARLLGVMYCYSEEKRKAEAEEKQRQDEGLSEISVEISTAWVRLRGCGSNRTPGGVALLDRSK